MPLMLSLGAASGHALDYSFHLREVHESCVACSAHQTLGLRGLFGASIVESHRTACRTCLMAVRVLLMRYLY
jgi:hypothetical protein